MSIVSTSNRWLNRLYKTVAIILVLLAVAISAFRLFLPYVHQYREPLQDYLNESAQTNIAIGSLDMTWQHFGPSLVIGEVTVLQTEHASVEIESLEVQVDFWKSISQQSLISKDIIITGAQIEVTERWQQHSDTEESSTDTEPEAKDIDAIIDVFVNRIKRFSIKDSLVKVHTQQVTRSIEVNNLQWLNTGDRHQAKGSVVLNGLSSNTLQLKVDVTGDDSSDLKGDLYLQANHIDITPWLDKLLVLDGEKTKTDFNFSALFSVEESRLQSAIVNFLDSTMDWSFEDKKQKLTLGKGQAFLTKSEGEATESFNLYTSPLNLTLNKQYKQSFTVQLSKKQHDLSFYMSEIDIAMVASLAPLLVKDEATRKLISTMDLTGKISDLHLKNVEEKLQITADFSQFTNQYSHKIPGLENVSGELSLVDDFLSVNFEATQGHLDFDKLFVQAFPYDKLTGQLDVAFNQDGWELNVEKLDFLSKEINLSAQVRVDAPDGGEVNLSLLTNVSEGNAGLVGRYLPLPIMSKNLVQYLNDAVVSGLVENAQVLINGPIKHFPFVDGSGIFVVDAELTDAQFKFVNSWPAINDFVANLNFTNNSMLITGRGGDLTGLDVTGVTAEISNLAKGQILEVNADIKSTAAQNISNLINQSPLEKSVGNTLDYLNISGNVTGDFSLNLPLKAKDKGVAKGTIIFDNNTASLRAPAMEFSEIKGELSFNKDKVNTEKLKLIWQGLPVNIDIAGLNKTDYYQTSLSLSALWKADEWRPHVPERLLRYTAGAFPWQGELELYNHHEGGFSYKGDFNSDLVASKLLLPTPYNRDKDHDKELSVNVTGRDAQSTIKLNYGEKLHFTGVLNHQDTAFSRANLAIGEEVMALPSDGFHITTKLEHAEFSQWQPLISDILDSINNPSTNTEQQDKQTPLLAKPKRIRGSIGKLTILGQTLNQVSFNLLDQADWWLLQLNSNEARSQTKIYPNWLEQGLDIDAEFIHTVYKKEETADKSLIEPHQPNKLENDIIFANIPPLKFHCDSCSVGLLDLGTVDVQVERTDHNTITFKQFDASRKNAQLSLSGRWHHDGLESNTNLTGSLSIVDIEKEAKAFSYESIVRDSGAKAELNFDWQGGLHDFSIAQLTGQYRVEADDGYLADVSDKARIFSVLSLQSLVRKLTLDFRDIFSDGMFYSSIEGDYQLDQGVLTTQNTQMNGTAGNLFMTGQTNLLTGELNYDMSYKPELTSSLPVLAWIATLDPITFLAGVAIDQVIKSQVVSEFNFKLTGTIDDPNFREIDRKSKSVSVDTTTIGVDVNTEANPFVGPLIEPDNTTNETNSAPDTSTEIKVPSGSVTDNKNVDMGGVITTVPSSENGNEND